ncbi:MULTISPECIES: hypothetical protein [Pasteurellaceae]|uniref:Uncharacterized protein n=2 Tax=Actinobacillus TaxID=713 RepID=A0ABT1WQU0_ACTSU|nr:MULTISPECIES: hypothetical protein [Pasteurellaceae]AIZ79129.1 hypothetical protein ACEE_04950 [Actinobacillus equuli subsp. equuli]EFL80049.1 hypothetical protein APP6_0530 [Actinobacillus pleuropneumoniae serovar 6 str. Femo]MCQ9628668.1 hypothetical protein [Actinobacillus suis]MCQ9631397.1 hypothetical protein [Actinobacillus suis]NNI17188.1 hypothetical protein [Pasteurella multocida]
MENLTINFCTSDEEVKFANIDKLKLLLCLCEAKLEKDITLPFQHVTVLGTDYITDDYADLIKSLRKFTGLSRKIGLSFIIWENEAQKSSDFNF